MFLADNARTLAYGRCCEAELTRRHIDDTEPGQLVTADEWLATDRAAQIEDDRHRDITAADLSDSIADHCRDRIDASAGEMLRP